MNNINPITEEMINPVRNKSELGVALDARIAIKIAMKNIGRTIRIFRKATRIVKRMEENRFRTRKRDNIMERCMVSVEIR